MIIRHYKKRPVKIEAVQYDGTSTLRDAICGWTNQVAYEWRDDLFIDTLEGDMKVSKGDFVIKGVAGEFYACKPDIFAKTYEATQ